MLSQLFQPFSYLTIHHSEKRKVDWLFPLLLAVTTSVLICVVQPKINIYGDKGLIQSLTQFVQTLPGFYIAALAAIATFSNERMDELIPEPTPTINESSRGVINEIPLTRRRFLSALFAFLTAESFLLVIAGIFIGTLAPTFKEIIGAKFQFSIAFGLFFIYCFFFFQMLIATFWGLYYLGTRIYRTTN